MASIFEAPTIEQQAAVLRNGGRRFRGIEQWFRSSPRARSGPSSALDLMQDLLSYLAQRLGSDQPLLLVDPDLQVDGA